MAARKSRAFGEKEISNLQSTFNYGIYVNEIGNKFEYLWAIFKGYLFKELNKNYYLLWLIFNDFYIYSLYLYSLSIFNLFLIALVFISTLQVLARFKLLQYFQFREVSL